jgi:hypothetical protein
VRSWYRKKYRVTKKDPEVLRKGKLTAKNIFARANPKTIHEVQKRLFEIDHPFPFPYSMDRYKDVELPPIDKDDLLLLDQADLDDVDGESLEDELREEEEASGERGHNRGQVGSGASHTKISDISTDEEQEVSLGDDDDIGNGSDATSAPTLKQISKLAFSYYQKALTVAMSELSDEQRRQYALWAKITRVKCLSVEDKRRYVAAALAMGT